MSYLDTYNGFLFHYNHVTWEYTNFGGSLGSRKVHKTKVVTRGING
jgi:hypothetical protein